jgi:sugar-specific transcriptional regulator TrmB
MEDDLKKIGLTDNEAKVYASLLRIGETAVGGLIEELKMHRQLIYNALDGLERRGLVSRLTKNGVYHFKVADPRIMIENARKQELVAERLSKNIALALKKSKHEQEINVFSGQSRMKRYIINQYRQCREHSTVYIINGYRQKFEDIVGRGYLQGEYEKIRAKKKIHSLHLASALFKNEFEKATGAGANLRQVRFLPYELTHMVTTVIWEKSINIESYLDDPFIVEIKNQKFRNSYLEHFKLLWKIARN